jgi:hypothetical protein
MMAMNGQPIQRASAMTRIGRVGLLLVGAGLISFFIACQAHMSSWSVNTLLLALFVSYAALGLGTLLLTVSALYHIALWLCQSSRASTGGIDIAHEEKPCVQTKEP